MEMDRLQGQKSPLHAIHHSLPEATLRFLPTRPREYRPKLATFLSLFLSFILSRILALSLSQSLPAPHPCFKTSPGASLFIVELTSTPCRGRSMTSSGQLYTCRPGLTLPLTILRRSEPLHPPYFYLPRPTQISILFLTHLFLDQISHYQLY